MSNKELAQWIWTSLKGQEKMEETKDKEWLPAHILSAPRHVVEGDPMEFLPYATVEGVCQRNEQDPAEFKVGDRVSFDIVDGRPRMYKNPSGSEVVAFPDVRGEHPLLVYYESPHDTTGYARGGYVDPAWGGWAWSEYTVPVSGAYNPPMGNSFQDALNEMLHSANHVIGATGFCTYRYDDYDVSMGLFEACIPWRTRSEDDFTIKLHLRKRSGA